MSSIVAVVSVRPSVPMICCGKAGPVVNSAPRVTTEVLVIKGRARMITSEMIGAPEKTRAGGNRRAFSSMEP